jgi:hypothetical protein
VVSSVQGLLNALFVQLDISLGEQVAAHIKHE